MRLCPRLSVSLTYVMPDLGDPEKDPSSAFNTLTFLLQGRTSFFSICKPRTWDNGIHYWERGGDGG